jgi:hypothetical protein
MKAHKNTIIVCFVGCIIFLNLTIILKLLDNQINDIFYNISIAIFTGLIISLITTTSMYFYEKNTYINGIYNSLKLIYQYLVSTNIEFCKLTNELKNIELFTSSKTINLIDEFTQQIIKVQKEMPHNSYVNLIRKNGKSNLDNYFCYMKWFLYDLWSIRYLSQNLEQKVLLYQTQQTNKDIAKINQDNETKIHSMDIKLNHLVVDSASLIGEGKTSSVQLAVDIERLIIMLRKLHRFDDTWENEKNFIIQQAQLLCNSAC